MSATSQSLGRYEEWHEELPVDAGGDAPWHQLVKRHLNSDRDLAEKDVLEIGCGRGGFAVWLADRARPPRHFVAADFSSTAVQKGREFAQELGISGISWETADLMRLPYGDGSFDTIVSCETIEHVPDPRRGMRELARVLRPGGRLFLTTPNYLGPLGAYRTFVRLRGGVFTEGGQPINHFTTLPATCWWVARAGLHLKSVDGAGHYLPLRGGLVDVSRFGVPQLVFKWFAHHSLVVGEKAA